VAGGVTAVQLRDPAATARQLCRAAAELLEVLAGTGVPLLINDRVDVAMAVGAQGVHLGQSDLPPAAARQLAGDGFIIGWSVTEPGQLRALEGLAPGTVDYLGVGPVYATATKPDAATPIGVTGIGEVCRHSPLPVVGIGGIDATNAGAVIHAGAVGVSVISAICGAADAEAAARALGAAVTARSSARRATSR